MSSESKLRFLDQLAGLRERGRTGRALVWLVPAADRDALGGLAPASETARLVAYAERLSGLHFEATGAGVWVTDL